VKVLQSKYEFTISQLKAEHATEVQDLQTSQDVYEEELNRAHAEELEEQARVYKEKIQEFEEYSVKMEEHLKLVHEHKFGDIEEEHSRVVALLNEEQVDKISALEKQLATDK